MVLKIYSARRVYCHKLGSAVRSETNIGTSLIGYVCYNRTLVATDLTALLDIVTRQSKDAKV